MTRHDEHDDNYRGNPDRAWLEQPRRNTRQPRWTTGPDWGGPSAPFGTAVWITLGTPVEAFNVPRDVGARTLAHLHARLIDLPVINIPGPPDRWALLTMPYAGPRGELLDLFTGNDVGYAYTGHQHGRSSN